MQTRQRSENRELPLATVFENNGHALVSAVNKTATKLGIFQGMNLTDALAFLPTLETTPADPIADTSALTQIVRWCGRYTPLTATDGLDGVWLDTTGCAHLFGSEQAMLDDLIVRLEYSGFNVHAAMADTPGMASAMARYGISGTVIDQGCTRKTLASLPMAALRLNTVTVTKLSHFGLRSVGDLYGIPRAPLMARFGSKLLLRLDQALGRVDEPIAYIAKRSCYQVRTVLTDPISEHKIIVDALERLIVRMCHRLKSDGYGCRRLEFTLYRTDGTSQQIQIGTSRPICSPRHLVRLFASGLETLDPGFGVETLSLMAPLTELLTVRQFSFFTRQKRFSLGEGTSSSQDIGALDLSSSVSFADVELSQLIDRLGNRLGFNAVLRLSPRKSFLPERVVCAVPVNNNVAPYWSPFLPNSYLPPRPLRLLLKPEPVETMILTSSKKFMRRQIKSTSDRQGREQSTKDRPPVLFRWRQVIHRVQNTEGPERIKPEWWREDGSWVSGARDYWRVEDVDGNRFWLYCQVREKPGTIPGWFLHGLFA